MCTFRPTFKLKISGNGTANQLATRLNEIVIKLQVKDVYKELYKLEGVYEDDILLTEIKEENNGNYSI